MSFNAFEHKLLNSLKSSAKKFEGQKVYISCSGGVDSVALFKSILTLKPILKFSKLALLHIHHGKSEKEPEQSAYRDKALVFCKELSENHGVEFLPIQSEKFLKSEEDCRDFRKETYLSLGHVFLGQHKDDFVETMVLRLIRGTGVQGLSEPFKEDQNIYRPFLKVFSKSEVLNYAKEHGLLFLEDPTNVKNDYLRNWVRNKWLPMLNEVDGLKSFSKSLENISDEYKGKEKAFLGEIKFESLDSGQFSDQLWLSLDRYQKQSTLAHILLKLVKSGYTSSQVNEVLRVLDQNPGNARFKSGGVEWTRDAGLIKFKLAK